MTKDNFTEKINFANDEEKVICDKYIRLKGLKQHIRIAELVGYNSNSQLAYKKISDTYKYDKRLRDTLYKYISMFEEYIRAYIGNKYEFSIYKIKPTSRLNKEIEIKGSLSFALEELELTDLLANACRLCKEDKKELLIDYITQKGNIRPLCKLRNAVSHHKFLLVVELLTPSIDFRGTLLSKNIKNLQGMLPEEFQEGFANSINNCLWKDRENNIQLDVPTKCIV